MTANILVNPDQRGVKTRAASVQWLKHERGNVEIALRAAIFDFVDLHEPVACRAPGAIGLGLLAKHACEVWPCGVGRLGWRGNDRARTVDRVLRTRRRGSCPKQHNGGKRNAESSRSGGQRSKIHSVILG